MSVIAGKIFNIGFASSAKTGHVPQLWLLLGSRGIQTGINSTKQAGKHVGVVMNGGLAYNTSPVIIRSFSEKAGAPIQKRRWPWFVAGIVVGGFFASRGLKHRREKKIWKMGATPMEAKGWREGLLVKYKGVVLPKIMMRNIESIEKMDVRPDDVFVVSFPQSGASWGLELTQLVNHGGDVEAARSETSGRRYRFLEAIFPRFRGRGHKCDKVKEGEKEGRVFESHLPMKLLPEQVETKNPKIIYIARNPRDVITSFYEFNKVMPFIRFSGTFEEFVGRFVDGEVGYCPWSDHVTEYWKCRGKENVLFLQYEDMKKDISGTVRKISEFLDKPLTEDQVTKIVETGHFDRLDWRNSRCFRWHEKDDKKWNEKEGWWKQGGNWFLLKGDVGEWQKVFNPSLTTQVDNMVNETLGSSGLKFDYEPSSK